jgi:hypothetical protein
LQQQGTEEEEFQVIVVFVAGFRVVDEQQVHVMQGTVLQISVWWWLGGAPPCLAWPWRRPMVEKMLRGLGERCQTS